MSLHASRFSHISFFMCLFYFLLYSMKHDAKICSIDWNPNGTKEILFADEMVLLYTVVDKSICWVKLLGVLSLMGQTVRMLLG